MFSFISCGNMSVKSEYSNGELEQIEAAEAQASEERKGQDEVLKKCTNLSKKMSLMIEVHVDKEELIGQIKATPGVWDFRTEDYSVKHRKLQAWERITAHFFENFYQMPDYERQILVINVQKIWRNMRICYCREIKKAVRVKAGMRKKSKHKYVYFEQLKFLKAVSKKIPDPLDGTDNYIPDSQSEDSDSNEWNERKQEDHNKEGTVFNQTRKRIREDNCDLTQAEAKKAASETLNLFDRNEERDEDKLFLLSLLSEVHKVPAQNKLKLRYDIIAAIANAQALKPQQWLPLQ